MGAPLSAVDPDGLLEYSVVFTDRSLNHMSKRFQQVMRDIHAVLRDVYNADAVVVVPGGGTVGMEAVARQFATDKNVMIVRNGWFSYRWTQILETGKIAETVHVMKAARVARSSPGTLRAAGHRRCRRGNQDKETRRRLRAACRNILRDHAARRIHRSHGRCRA